MDGKWSRIEILRQTTYHMIHMGFRARQKGYRYLREAVWMAYCCPESLNSVTKLLYPEVAKAFCTTDKQVERAIRNTIETAWERGNKEALKAFFGEHYGKGDTRPTNTEVIEVFVNYFSEEL